LSGGPGIHSRVLFGGRTRRDPQLGAGRAGNGAEELSEDETKVLEASPGHCRRSVDPGLSYDGPGNGHVGNGSGNGLRERKNPYGFLGLCPRSRCQFPQERKRRSRGWPRGE